MNEGFKSLIVLMGLPSSGKSTIARLLAKELTEKTGLVTTVIGSDDMRQLIPSQLDKFDPNLEPFIKDLTLMNLKFCLQNNYIVINDDMNYYKSMRHELKQIAEENNAHFMLIHIQIPLKTALEWNEKRGLPLPQEVIQRVYDRFDPPGDYKWDNPLVTVQLDKVSSESAIKTILSNLLPIINKPLEHKQLPPAKKLGMSEKIDKFTREIITKFAKSNKDPKILKKISKFRIQFIKNLSEKDVPMDSLKKEFSEKLQEFITSLK